MPWLAAPVPATSVMLDAVGGSTNSLLHLWCSAALLVVVCTMAECRQTVAA